MPRMYFDTGSGERDRQLISSWCLGPYKCKEKKARLMRLTSYSLNKCEKTEQLCRWRRCRLPGKVKLGADKPEIISKLENLRHFLSLKPLPLLQLDPLIEQTPN